MIIGSGEYHDHIKARLFYAAYTAATSGLAYSVEIEFDHHPALDPHNEDYAEEWGYGWDNLDYIFDNLSGWLEADGSVFLEFITDAYPAWTLDQVRSVFRDVVDACEEIEKYEDGLVSSNGTHISFIAIANEWRMRIALHQFSGEISILLDDEQYRKAFFALFGRGFNKYAMEDSDVLNRYAWVRVQSSDIYDILEDAKDYIDDHEFEEYSPALDEYYEDVLVRIEWRLSSFQSYEQFMLLQETLWKVSRNLFQGNVDAAVDALNNALEEAKHLLEEETTA